MTSKFESLRIHIREYKYLYRVYISRYIPILVIILIIHFVEIFTHVRTHTHTDRKRKVIAWLTVKGMLHLFTGTFKVRLRILKCHLSVTYIMFRIPFVIQLFDREWDAWNFCVFQLEPVFNRAPIYWNYVRYLFDFLKI